jgi:aminopeptidase-like protein
MTEQVRSLRQARKSIDFAEAGAAMYALMANLYPICRSITGNGVRETLSRIGEVIPLEVHEVPTGTRVFDWEVPKEWNIRDAFIKNSRGERVVDFQKSNLHVVNYSLPVHQKFSLGELKKHLFSLEQYPGAIPYRTSYYHPAWGFCLTYDQFSNLREDTYEVCIDSSLEDGHLTYGEYFIQGRSEDEVLISVHICHPSLANDNLSGMVLAPFLGRILAKASLNYSYRFLFIPGTIGSITWLAMNEALVPRIKHGLVAVCLGDSGGFTYKKSRRGDTQIDRIVPHVFKALGRDVRVREFFPFGYDERQYCSPGFNLPVGCLMRTPHGEYKEYHTSADNLGFVLPVNLSESLAVLLEIVNALEINRTYLNRNPKCEPQLGRRGLYQKIGGQYDGENLQMAMLWVLNGSDGNQTLLDISVKSGFTLELLSQAAGLLMQFDLLEEVD